MPNKSKSTQLANKKASSKWGGRRTPGPGKKLGRHLRYEGQGALIQTTVRLSQDHLDFLKRLGGDNLSEGVRIAAEFYQAQHVQPPADQSTAAHAA